MDNLEIFPIHRVVTRQVVFPFLRYSFIVLLAPVAHIRGFVGMLPCSRYLEVSYMFLVKFSLSPFRLRRSLVRVISY